MTRLRQVNWEEEDFEGLAREIWWLQPPFLDPKQDKSKEFTVEFTTPYPEVLKTFERQMTAFMDLWHAKIDGRLIPAKNRQGRAQIALQFSDGERHSYEHEVEECLIDQLRFELRTYYLTGRQKHGIKVGEAREYFEENGGVYVYDSGFRLPYYGGKEHDWLGLEFAHAHRLSRSKLLPDELQITEGLTYLPTNSRVLGSVHINTAHERSRHQGRTTTTEHLEIQVTRDRLVDNRAYEQLCEVVRAAIDFYAVTEASRVHQRKLENMPSEPLTKKLERVDEVLERFADDIPKPVFLELRTGVKDAIEASESEAEDTASQIALLGPLATAGMAALAHEHEAARQMSTLKGLVTDLDREIQAAAPNSRLLEVRDRLKAWIAKASQTRRLFTHLLDDEDREREANLRAASVLRDVANQSASLLRGVSVSVEDVHDDLRLPAGTFAEWSALFQNVLINAGNAMLDVKERRISVASNTRGKTREIRVEDSGVGIDLAKSPRLFEPFARDLEISSERRRLGLGGSGLGLTIVRMIAENRGCRVDFTSPSPGFSTAFRLSWKEK